MGGDWNLFVKSRNGHTTCAIVQVQKDAPVELLLGTDTLPQLGFALLEMDLSETGVDSLQKQTWKKQPRGCESTSIPDDRELTAHDDIQIYVYCTSSNSLVPRHR